MEKKWKEGRDKLFKRMPELFSNPKKILLFPGLVRAFLHTDELLVYRLLDFSTLVGSSMYKSLMCPFPVVSINALMLAKKYRPDCV